MRRKIIYACGCLLALYLCIVPFQQGKRNMDMDVVLETLAPYVETSDLQEQNAAYLRKHFQLSTEQYKEAHVFASGNAMQVEEIVIVVSDTYKDEQIYNIVKQRIENQEKAFKGYGDQQMDVLNKAQIIQQGTYTILLILPDTDAAVMALQSL